MCENVDALARQIKGGNLDLLPTLWDNVSRFIYKCAYAWLSRIDNSLVEVDDLVHESYFSLQTAVDGWDEERGGFLTYLKYHLLSSFHAAYFGGRTTRINSDPINNHSSLDAPINTDSDDDISLLDTIIDTKAEAYYRNIEDVDFWSSVSVFLRKCILQVKDDIGRECMLYMLSNDWDTLFHVGSILYPEHNNDSIRYHFETACRQLKRILNYSSNIKAAKGISLDYEIYGGGYTNFVCNNYTSSIERAVIKKIDDERYLRDMADVIATG